MTSQGQGNDESGLSYNPILRLSDRGFWHFWQVVFFPHSFSVNVLKILPNIGFSYTLCQPTLYNYKGCCKNEVFEIFARSIIAFRSFLTVLKVTFSIENLYVWAIKDKVFTLEFKYAHDFTIKSVTAELFHIFTLHWNFLAENFEKKILITSLQSFDIKWLMFSIIKYKVKEILINNTE